MSAPRGSENGNRYSRTGYEVLTRSGIYIDVRAPRADQIVLHDIAVSLSKQIRFTGHCPLQPSVAEHSVAVAHIAGYLMPDEWAPDLGPEACRRRLMLAALMHDGSEMLVSDLNGAVKSWLRPKTHGGKTVRKGARSTFDVLEARAMAAIEERFDCAVAEDWHGLIHEADCMACAYEMAAYGWCTDADPPRWVATDPFVQRCYGTRDGGRADFLSTAYALGVPRP